MLSIWKMFVKWNTFAPGRFSRGYLGSMSNDGAAQRRHPEEGGYARGGETRARIVAAALQIFGEQGYDQASTRRIAASAGVNPPALQYYFGGKEGLHRACAQFIIDRMLAVMGPALALADAATQEGRREAAVDALCGLLEAMVDGLVATGSESWGRFIARGKADGAGPAMGMLHEHFGSKLRDAAVRLVATATGQSPRDEMTRLRAMAILGQVTVFYANRENCQVAMGWRDLDARALGLIKSVVSGHARAALGGWSEAPRSRSRARS